MQHQRLLLMRMYKCQGKLRYNDSRFSIWSITKVEARNTQRLSMRYRSRVLVQVYNDKRVVMCSSKMLGQGCPTG